MANCSNCIYKMYPRIPASVPRRARIAIVGEAPGPVEIARKKPFVGPSGELVRKAFQSLGLPPYDEVYVTNALLCRPPSGKPISKEAIVQCRARLMEELELVRPEIVIAFGNTSMQSLTGDYKKKITKEQGRLIQDHLLSFKSIVIPVFHPAAILRDGGKYPQFLQSLRRVKDAVSGVSMEPPPEPSYTVVETPEQVERAVRGLANIKYFMADIETSGYAVDGRILCLGICWKPGKVLIFPEQVIPQLKGFFENTSSRWIWQGGKYDVGWLRPRGLPARIDEDTMMLHYALNENPGTHDLEQISMQFLGDQPWKHLVDAHIPKGVTKQFGYAYVPKSILYRYLALDVDRGLRLFERLYPIVMADSQLKRLYRETLLPACSFLSEVEYAGLRPNLVRMEEVESLILDEMYGIVDTMRDIAAPIWNVDEYVEASGAKSVPKQFNPGSVKQLGWLLFDKLRLRGQKNKITKAWLTDEEHLKLLKDKHPIVAEVLRYRSLRKKHGTYIKGPRKRTAPDGRVHSSFNPHGTVTGRLSSSDPNIQNVPKDMRAIYYAREGYELVEADYKGAELRVLAYISGDKFMSDVFEQGRDLHTEVEKALNIERIKAKTINFGKRYAEVKSLSYR